MKTKNREKTYLVGSEREAEIEGNSHRVFWAKSLKERKRCVVCLYV